MPRNHKPSSVSRQTHSFSMAKGVGPRPTARRTARRCSQCRYLTTTEGHRCTVCTSGIAVTWIDDALMQAIYLQQRVQKATVQLDMGRCANSLGHSTTQHNLNITEDV